MQHETLFIGVFANWGDDSASGTTFHGMFDDPDLAKKTAVDAFVRDRCQWGKENLDDLTGFFFAWDNESLQVFWMNDEGEIVELSDNYYLRFLAVNEVLR